MSKNQILTCIKGHNPVANLRKTTIYNTNVDLVNDDEHTKGPGLIRGISGLRLSEKVQFPVLFGLYSHMGNMT